MDWKHDYWVSLGAAIELLSLESKITNESYEILRLWWQALKPDTKEKN